MKQACLACLIFVFGCKSGSPEVAAAPGENPSDAGAGVFLNDSGMVATRADAGAYSGGGDDGGVNGPGAPTVEIVQPAAASDPNQDELLTDGKVSVRCRVTRSTDSVAADVNKSSVEIALAQPEDLTEKITPAVNALAGDEYEAVFDLSELPNGPLHFSCRAQDLAMTPHVGYARLDTLLDLGPKIEFVDPKDKGIYALKTPIVIQIQVTPSKVTKDDEEADVTEVKLTVGGVDVPVTESKSTPGLYQTSVDFEDRTRYPVPPTAAEIDVVARNSRTPSAATREQKIDVVVDGEGPILKVESPANASIVHGIVALRVNATDRSGVKPNSLIASINSDTLVIKQWDVTPPIYVQSFDTRKFPPDEVTQLTINITASDSVGNQSTVSHLLRLDNKPPLLSLDPPFIREYTHPNATATYCSAAFDPVGADAVNDLAQVESSSMFRVLVIDQTNQSPGATTAYYAGVKQDTIVLYADSHVNEPLLVDTDGDGFCDEINDPALIRPGRTQIQLTPLTPRGTPWYDKDVDLHEPNHDIGSFPCTTNPNDNPEPQPLCGSTLMARVITGPIETRPPAIYALNPTNANMADCEGGSWELQSALGKDNATDPPYTGWVCLAARAEDTAGNIGVSDVMRACISNDISSDPACDPANAPDCLGTSDPCQVADALRFINNIVWRQQ